MTSLNAPEQLPLGVSLQDVARFENFQTGDNALLCSLLEQAAQGTGESFLYFWGQPGSGCSHLLQASCHAAGPVGRSAVYLPLQELQHTSPALLEGMEQLQLVCIDNPEAIAGQAVWEEALFHLYNRLREIDHTLLVAAQCPPRQLPIALPDLRSRLGWGAVFQVNPLQDDDKLQALRLRARIRGFDLPEEAARYLLHHGSRNMTDLCLALDQLDKASLTAQRKITIPFIKQALAW